MSRRRALVLIAWAIPVAALSLEAATARPATSPEVAAARIIAGRVLYDRRCAACHAGDLRGPQVPYLVGADFQRRWSPRTAAELADYILTMPPTNPDLTPAEAADLAALILAANGAPITGCPPGQRPPAAFAVASIRARDGGPACAADR
jgi:mono/diheme cytochrome c family protein